jgi:hypothetical protein
MNPLSEETSTSLHLPGRPCDLDLPQTLKFSNKNGTISTSAHIDAAMAGILNPVGTAIDVSTDVRGFGARRTPCP